MNELLNKIHFGDSFATMQDWPASFVDCTVTSVPYWQQRDYLPAGHVLKRFEMGGESTLEKYLADMADLFGEVYRVTKPTGVLFLNVGDKYAGPRTKKLCPGYRDGEVLGIPWKLSEALRSVGWYRISEIIWEKPNANPEATSRRPSCSHESLFLFAKGPNHFFDAHPIQSPSKYPHKPRGGPAAEIQKAMGASDGREGADPQLFTRCRSVWPISTESFDGRKLMCDFKETGRYLIRDPGCLVHGDNPTASAGILFASVSPDPECSCDATESNHFAAMPTRLAERCILAGTSEVGCCPQCPAPYRRVVRKERIATRPGHTAKHDTSGKAHRDPQRHVSYRTTIAWEATCGHPLGVPVRPVVFDPFVGTGTTLVVAKALGRDYLGCELSPEYALKIAPARIKAGWLRSPILT